MENYMGSFLNYLDDFNKKIEKTQKRIVENNLQKESFKKEKVLSLNVEVRSIDGAKLVIEKLQDWINKIELENGISQKNQKSFKQSPKKIPNIIKIPKNIKESTSHAVNILDGLPENGDNISINKDIIPQVNNQNNYNLNKVTSHASDLL
jgi:hypothetical protein